MDDYGHHPTEIAAVLDAARPLNRRVVVVFQPHRYTRTASLMDAFGPALASADQIVLTDIYAAGEDPIPGITLDALASSIREQVDVPVHVAPTLDDVVTEIARIGEAGRRRHHARCGIDRHASRIACSRRAGHESGDRARTADRALSPRARQAGTEAPPRAVEAARRLRRPSSRPRSRSAVTGVSDRAAAQAHVLQVDRIVVHGNERLSRGEVMRGAERAARREPRLTDLDALARAAAGVAVGRRRGAAPIAAVDGRRRSISEREPIGIGRIN